MTLRDILRVVFRYKLIVITVFMTIMVTVIIGLELRTPLYESRVKILVTGKMPKDVEVQRELGPGSLIETQRVLVKSLPVIERTVKALKLYQRPLDYERQFASRLKAFLIDRHIEKLKLRLEKMTPEQRMAFLYRRAVGNLMGRISTRPVGKDTSIFEIIVRDYSPAGAAIIANSISRSYVIFDLEQQIAELQLIYGEKNATIIKLENHIKKLQDSLNGKPLPDIDAIGPASVKIIDQAKMGTMVRMRPSRRSALIAGFIMSLVTSIVLAFIFDYADQTFKSPQDVKSFLNLPLLGSIPKKKRKNQPLITEINPVTEYTQSFLNLSEQIYLSMKAKNLKTLLITDAEGSEDTVKIIANLSAVLAYKAGHKVLIIDANLRTPEVSKIFKISNVPGLADVLEGKISFEDAVQNLDSNLTVLPAGETILNPINLLESSTMSDLIKRIQGKYDLIFINSADLKNFIDAVVLSSVIDGVILVVNEGKTRRHVVKNAIIPLEQKKVNILGIILNNRKYVIPKIIYKIT
jgi:capsular exopolysaccharide synthesis family protein